MGGNKDSVHFEKADPPKEEGKEQKTEKVESAIPEEFLTDKQAEPDEYETLIKEEPKGPVKHENYKKFQAAADKKVQALMKQLEETRSKLPKDDFVPEKVSKQLSDLQAKLQEKEDLISRKYVEESPEFQERFAVRKESIVNRLNKAAKDFELSDRVVKSLLSTDSLKERAEILDEAGLGTAGASTISAILDNYDSVEAERADFLSNWKSKAGELEQAALKRQDAEKARIKQLEDKAFDEVLGEMSSKYSVLKKIDGNKEWNAKIDSDIKAAKAIFDGDFSPHTVAELAIAGRAAQRMGEMLETVIARYKDAVRERDELKAANPKFEAGGKDSKTDPTKNMTNDERAAYTFNQFKSLAR